jgi:hypothetical protein
VIRIEEGRVKHWLLDCFILSDVLVVDLVLMEISKTPWAAVILFNEHRTIRFIGVHLDIMGALQATLEDETKATKTRHINRH